MALKLGGNDVADVRLGSSQLSAIYQGVNKVWPTTPLLVGSAVGTDLSDSVSIDVSGIDIQPGDLILTFLCWDAVFSGSWAPAFTTVDFLNGFSCIGGLYQRTADGTETTLTWTGGGTGLRTVGIAVVYRNAVLTTPPFTGTENATGMPDPGSLAGIQSTSVVLAWGGIEDSDIILTPPSGYTSLESDKIFSGGDGASACLSEKKNPSATENPGVFGGGGNNDWVAYTVEVRAA